MKPSSADPQQPQSNPESEAILGDTSLLALCAFLAVLLQLWQQGFSSSVC